MDRLSEAELVELHHKIVERLRFLEQMRAHASMLEFSIGDRVCFESGKDCLIRGHTQALQQANRDDHHRRPSPLECLTGLPAQTGSS
jgi:hypothetical protein